jgi:inward rectifier potassium channel
MSVQNNRNKFRDIVNTGFGANSSAEGGRLINRDGSTNLRKTGMRFWNRISLYHTLLKMNRIHFLLSIFIFYTSINLAFALLYFIIGAEHLTGMDGNASAFRQFLTAFFFSSQTLTTVGYGHISPSGTLTNFVASLESLLGILSFAVVTGLIYGRFSRPRAYILFSDNIIFAPYRGGKGLMFRITTYKNNHLTDVEAQLTLALHVNENGKMVTKFYPLPLELPKVISLALSWTIVHPINEESPLYNYDEAMIAESKMEVIVNMKAFDDHFSNVVQQRTSYTHHQVVYGAKFLPMFEREPGGRYTILELEKINLHERVLLSENAPVFAT